MTCNQTHADYHKIRLVPRFQGEIPVILDQGDGVTRDYSTAGIYFLTEASYAPGDAVNFTLLLNNQPNGRSVRVQCRGTVVRTSPEENRLGVAVKVEDHRFTS